MIAYFYPPMGDGGVFRNLKFTRYLPGQGWLPEVLCGQARDYWVRDESLLEQIPPETRVHRVAGLTGLGVMRRAKGGGELGSTGRRSTGLFRGLRRLSDLLLFPDSYAGWKGPALRRGRKILAEGGIELIYSSGPPDTVHRVGAALAAESGLPWVADFRDLWYNLHLKTPPTDWHRARHARAEAEVLSRASVVTVTEGWRRLLQERGGRPVTLVRNGFDPADFEKLPEWEDSDPRRVMLHTGKLSLDRSALPFLEGLSRLVALRPGLAEELRVDFLGPRESENEAVLDGLGLAGMVRFLGSRPHREALSRQRAADLLLLLHQREERYRDLVPGKLYEYAGAGRPVLAVAPEGEVQGLVRGYELGWWTPPEAGAVARQLEEALSHLDRGWRRPEKDLAPLTRPWQAARLAQLFDSLREEAEA